MPTLTITKNYDDGTILTESQLDDIKTSIETFVNTTKLDADNIQDAAITSGKLASSAVTTASITDGAVTKAKQAAAGQVLSSAINTNGTDTSFVDVTNATRTFTTSSANRPVMIMLQPEGGSAAGYVGAYSTSATDVVAAKFKLVRDSTDIAQYQVISRAKEDANSDIEIYVPPGCISFLDTGATASTTHTYKLQALRSGANASWTVSNCKLVVYEL